MAIYHLTAQIISRSSGRCVLAAAAYRHAIALENERTGERHDYCRKRGVEHSEILAPKDAPAWAGDRQTLWGNVDSAERRKDAQLAREIEVAIPRELTAEASTRLVRKYVQENFVSEGMVADFAIHKVPSTEPNLSNDGYDRHAHILLTLRSIKAEGFGGKVRKWNDRDRIQSWRKGWSKAANEFMASNGIDSRIDHRTLDAQRAEALENGDLAKSLILDRPPQPKLGPAVGAIEKKARDEAHAKNEPYAPVTERGRAYAASKSRLTAIAEAAMAKARQHKILKAFFAAAQRWGTEKIRRWIKDRSPLPQSDNLRNRINVKRLSRKLKNNSIRNLGSAAKAILERERRKKLSSQRAKQSGNDLSYSPSQPHKAKGPER